MLRRTMMLFLLALFGGVMVLLLMLDDPSVVDRRQAPLRLFPQLNRAEHVNRIEVQNVTEGTGVLLVRDEAGVWYAAQTPQTGPSLSAGTIDQAAVDALALSITRLAAAQWFEATPDNLVRFGLRPEPAYSLQFAGRDTAGRAFESVVFEVGDRNPDQVARYVWPRDGQQVYLLTIDFLLEPLPSVTTDAPPVP